MEEREKNLRWEEKQFPEKRSLQGEKRVNDS